MNTRPMSEQGGNVDRTASPLHVHDPATPLPTAAQNHRLQQQFSEFLMEGRRCKLSERGVTSYLANCPALKFNGVDVLIDPSRWPAAYQPSKKNLVIHPALLVLGRQNRQTLLYAVTEIFDQVIYAQLDAQLTRPDGVGVLHGADENTLHRLLAIKADKQEKINVAAMGSTNPTPAGAPAPTQEADPYSAWQLLVPRHGLELEVVAAFSNAIESFLRTRMSEGGQ
ncbi:MAG TPA: hypothetical protein VFV39_03285 [Limnobacter sp.]|nr:hypothetical protein [Limnobacter sp.]